MTEVQEMYEELKRLMPAAAAALRRGLSSPDRCIRVMAAAGVLQGDPAIMAPLLEEVKRLNADPSFLADVEHEMAHPSEV